MRSTAIAISMFALAAPTFADTPDVFPSFLNDGSQWQSRADCNAPIDYNISEDTAATVKLTQAGLEWLEYPGACTFVLTHPATYEYGKAYISHLLCNSDVLPDELMTLSVVYHGSDDANDLVRISGTFAGEDIWEELGRCAP